MSLAWTFAVERVTGIEHALSAWEAGVLPLNYTRVVVPVGTTPRTSYRKVRGRRDGCGAGSFSDVLLSDRDIRSELESGRVKIDPFDPGMVQPSSVDVRLDRFFRVF